MGGATAQHCTKPQSDITLTYDADQFPNVTGMRKDSDLESNFCAIQYKRRKIVKPLSQKNQRTLKNF
jgi:hypothetical protein